MAVRVCRGITLPGRFCRERSEQQAAVALATGPNHHLECSPRCCVLTAPTGGYSVGVLGRPSSSARSRRFDPNDAADTARARGETVDQVLDRNLGELLQELRVAITGVQILFAFLLGLAFTARFGTLGGFQLTLYTVALLSTALATLVLIAPVSFHRMVFRRRQKAALVAITDRLLMAGLGLLVLAITSAVLLILDVALGLWQGLVGAGLVALAGALTWYALPVWARRTGVGTVPELVEQPDREA
jgi:hypothetical protein